SEYEIRNEDFRGPDFFFVRGVSLKPPRPYWAVWKEGGKYPNLIIELGSPSTIQSDRTVKKDVYEGVFHTFEYFLFDPVTNTLYGWRLANDRYQPIEPNDNGWLWCEELHLWLGTWRGEFQGKEYVYVRFYDRQGHLVATDAEAEKQRAEAETHRAD